MVRRVGDAAKATMQPGRDVWWHEIVDASSDQCAAEPMDAEDMLFVLYTSGTTGKPKGIVHTSGGYLVGVSTTHQYIFDIKEERRLLVHGGHWLGHRALLHCVWAFGERRDLSDV